MKGLALLCCALLCVSVVLISGCTTHPGPSPDGGSGVTLATPLPGTIAHSGGPGESKTVRMKENSFDPSFLTIRQGTTVVWTNEDPIAHTVTYTGEGAKLFDSKNIYKGESFSYTFPAPGRYIYACTQHSSMTGTVLVE